MNGRKNIRDWYVIYTRPQCERKVAASISEMGIEVYLPLHTVIRQWSDRKKKMQVPLFPNYVFVRLEQSEKRAVHSVREFVKFVAIENTPVVVREKDILMIRQVLRENLEITEENYFQEATSIRIKQGQFQGIEGVIIKKYGSTRLLVRIEALMKAYSINVSSALVEAI